MESGHWFMLILILCCDENAFISYFEFKAVVIKLKTMHKRGVWAGVPANQSTVYYVITFDRLSNNSRGPDPHAPRRLCAVCNRPASCSQYTGLGNFLLYGGIREVYLSRSRRQYDMCFQWVKSRLSLDTDDKGVHFAYHRQIFTTHDQVGYMACGKHLTRSKTIIVVKQRRLSLVIEYLQCLGWITSPIDLSLSTGG